MTALLDKLKVPAGAPKETTLLLYVYFDTVNSMIMEYTI